MPRPKSQIRILQEKLINEYGLLVDNTVYNPITNRDIKATTANIKKIYNILLIEQKEQRKNRENRILKKFDDLLETGKKYLINVEMNDGKTQVLTLSSLSKDEIASLLARDYAEYVEDEYESDAVHTAAQNGVSSHTVVEAKATREIKNRDGSFFNYLNNTDLDLTKLQIIREKDDVKILKEQCLLHVLSLNGINKSLLNNIKLSLPGRAIPKKDIEKICRIIKKKIVINFYRNKQENHLSKEIHGKEYEEIIEVALYENHYFIYEKSEYSKYYIDNYERLKDIRNGKDIIKTKKFKSGKQTYEYNKNKKCTTLYLVNKLFKDGYFRKDTSKLSQVDDNASYQAEEIPLDNIDEEQEKVVEEEEEEEKAVEEEEEEVKKNSIKMNELIFYKTIETEEEITSENQLFFNKYNVDLMNERRQQPSTQFYDYFNSRRVKKGEIATHRNYTHPFGNIKVPKEEEDFFMSLYKDEIKLGSTLGVCEKQYFGNTFSKDKTKWIKYIQIPIKEEEEKAVEDEYEYDYNAFNDEVKEQEELEIKEDVENPNLFFADTETIVSNGEHEIYKIGVISKNRKEPRIYSANTDWISSLFTYVKQNLTDKKRTPIMYFHNLKYDFIASLKKHVICSEPVIKDNTIYRITIEHFGFKIELRDSYKLIARKLKDFTDIFKLPDDLKKKEAINYTFYNKKTLETTKHNVEEYIKTFKEEEKTIFYEALDKNEFEYDKFKKTFNANKYYNYYLKYDVLILKEGLLKLNEIIKTITGLDGKPEINIFSKSLTISSIAHNYMVKNGAYKDVYKLSGNIREFVSKAIYGGRVNVYEPIRGKVMERLINDFDAVSLYPSAMARLADENMGLPKGKAERIINGEYLNKDYYVVKIRITKINKKQKNPFIAVRSKTGVDYINNIVDPVIVYVDKITLEDYIKFHEIEYDFLDGVYWNNGFNPLIGSLVSDLFKERKRFKKEGATVIQEMVKLIMNSTYGKTIMKKSSKQIVYLNKNLFNKKTKQWSTGNENMNNYIYNNFNSIVSYKELNKNQIEITKRATDNSYNIGHAGVIILSMSKRIMNEVMGLASDNDINIYYQDTDSLHMDNDKIEKLSTLYKNEYKKEIIGTDMGQFHSDFSLKGAVSEVIATKSIFLGKKSYLDVLESKNKQGETITGYHIRMKGITQEGLDYHVNKFFGGNYLTFYEALGKGNEMELILNPSEKVMFEYTMHGVQTRETGAFKRTLKF